jgi:hypothetical protein
MACFFFEAENKESVVSGLAFSTGLLLIQEANRKADIENNLSS